jgi:Arc/MetJ family transcription regulator
VVYPRLVAKHLIDVDEEMLGAARAELGTTTIKDTVNEALRRATLQRERRTADALDVLANARLDDRADAWR